MALDFSDFAQVNRKIVDYQKQTPPDVVICCVGIAENKTVDEIDMLSWQRVQHVNVQVPFMICQCLAKSMNGKSGGDMVFLGGLDRTQSLPLPIDFAASQGALAAMVMAMSKAYAVENIRVNLIASGLLTEGLGQIFSADQVDVYSKYSCLKRLGKASEVAPVAVWLALHNTVLTGKVIPVNGGV